MKRVCISGYFGFDNIGDEAVLEAMIRSLRAAVNDIEIIVLSDNPEATAAAHGVTAYDRWRWAELRRAIKSADLLISGGGSLFQDTTGIRSLLYYLHVIKMALRRKKPVIIYAQGIGPIKSAWGRRRTVSVLRKAKRITVRDEDSADLLKAWGFRRGRVKITADPVLNIGGLERTEVLMDIAILPPEDASRFHVEPEGSALLKAPPGQAQTASAAGLSETADREAPAISPPVTDLEAALVLNDLKEVIAARRALRENSAPATAPEDVITAESDPAGEAPVTVGTAAETPTIEEAVAEKTAAAEADENVSPETAEAGIAPEAGNQEEATAASEKAEAAPSEGEAGAEATAAADSEEAARLVRPDGKVPFAALKREGERLAAFSLRQWEGLPIDDIVGAANYLLQQGYRLAFLPFQYPDDNRLEKEVIAKLSAPVWEVDRNLTPSEMLYCLDQVDFLFGMRLHALIMAAALKIPFASLSYDPKIDGFVKSLGLTVTGRLESYDSAAFLANFKAAVDSQEEICAKIEERLPELQEKAEEATANVKELLGRIRK